MFHSSIGLCVLVFVCAGGGPRGCICVRVVIVVCVFANWSRKRNKGRAVFEAGFPTDFRDDFDTDMQVLLSFQG